MTSYRRASRTRLARVYEALRPPLRSSTFTCVGRDPAGGRGDRRERASERLPPRRLDNPGQPLVTVANHRRQTNQELRGTPLAFDGGLAPSPGISQPMDRHVRQQCRQLDSDGGSGLARIHADRLAPLSWAGAGFRARIPVLVLTPFTGVLADRMDRRWLMLVGTIGTSAVRGHPGGAYTHRPRRGVARVGVISAWRH